MAYTPVVLEKGGRQEIAETADEEANLRWDGWLIVGNAPGDQQRRVTFSDLNNSDSEAMMAIKAVSGEFTGNLSFSGAVDFSDADLIGVTGGVGGAVTTDNITDASTLGRTLFKAASQADARSAIGAVTLGTTSTTAKAGNYTPPADTDGAIPSMRTLGTGAAQALPGNHPSTTNARPPTSHAASHATGGADALTPAQIGAAADVHSHTTATITDLTEAVQDIVANLIAPGTGLTKSYDDVAGILTLNATNGGVSPTDPALAEIVRDVIGVAIVQGSGIGVTVNDAGDTITIASTAVLPTRQVNTGTGLSGGGDLSANRTISVTYGNTAGTSVQGNDARVVADQAAATASIRTLGAGAQQAAPGDHTHTALSVQVAATPSVRALGTGATDAMAGNDSRVVGAAAKSQTEGVQIHDGTAGGGTRLTGYYRVRWVGGTARPTNMVTGDIWDHD